MAAAVANARPRAQEPCGQRVEPVCGGSLRPLDTAPHGILETGRQLRCEAGLAQARAQSPVIRRLAVCLHNLKAGHLVWHKLVVFSMPGNVRCFVFIFVLL